jgi:hypothetical protein
MTFLLFAATLSFAQAPPVPAPAAATIQRVTRHVPSGRRNAYRVLEDYARCVARSNRSDALGWLYSWDATDEAVRRAARLERSPSYCLRADEMRVSSELMQGAVAEALFEFDFPNEWSGEAQPAVPRPLVIGGDVPLRLFARCVVALRPDLARPILATPSATSEERRAIDRLAASWGSCAPAQRLAFRDSSLRSAVAIELYYLARASAGLGAPFAEASR